MVAHESKQRILAAAKELFLARGYAATTVDAICEKARLTKGSFYHFFDSKEELGLAVLDWSLQRSGQILSDGPHRQVADPVERALAFIDHIADSLAGVVEWRVPAGSLRARTCGGERTHAEGGLRSCFRPSPTTSRECSSLWLPTPTAKDGLTAHELADQLLGTLEGSIVLAKAHRDPSRIPKAIRAFRLAVTNLNAPVA